jgi:hypothetical protein
MERRSVRTAPKRPLPDIVARTGGYVKMLSLPNPP